MRVIKYGESSLIVTVYTRDSGRQAYIISGTRSKKSTKRAILQPLFLVNLVAYHKDTRELHRIKEIKNYPVYQNIPFDVLKSMQSLFISEILYKTLREQESSPKLFDFLKSSLLFFDLTEGSLSDFHLFFLFRLSGYLGFLPDMRQSGCKGYFDMRQGMVVPIKPVHSSFINIEATNVLSLMAGLKIEELTTIKISRNMRGYLTNKFVEYYRLHLENMGEIKSLKVLQEVFM